MLNKYKMYIITRNKSLHIILVSLDSPSFSETFMLNSIHLIMYLRRRMISLISTQ